MNIMPDSDDVARVDRHDETVQRIECRNRAKYASFPDCHQIERTVCELWRACGDPRKRNFHCTDFAQREELGKFFDSSGVTPRTGKYSDFVQRMGSET